MNKMAKTKAAMIHPQERSISGICNSVLGMRGPWSRLAIQAKPECPPNEAAAAEIRINIGLTGFSAPAMVESIPEVK